MSSKTPPRIRVSVSALHLMPRRAPVVYDVPPTREPIFVAGEWDDDAPTHIGTTAAVLVKPSSPVARARVPREVF